MTPSTPEERQTALELDMRSIGTRRFHKMIEQARKKGRETETPYGLDLLRKAVLPLIDGITKYLDSPTLTGAAESSARKYLKAFGSPNQAAFITAKAILDGISSPKFHYIKLAKKIASGLEDESRWRALEDSSPKEFQHAAKKAKSGRNGKKALAGGMVKAEVTWTDWPDADKVHLGSRLIELFVASTGLVSMEKLDLGAKNTPWKLIPSPAVVELIKKKNASGAVMQPELLPMIIPPRDWSSVWGGGYISHAVPRLPLVKTRIVRYLEDLDAIEMPKVYRAVNGLQRTAWQINQEVLMVFREIWNSGTPMKDLPPVSPEVAPPKPIGEGIAAENAWRRKSSKIWEENDKAFSKKKQTAQALAIAERFKDEPELYFPYQLDFRGRVYAVPACLHPQGSDLPRGLLRFSEGKPLGDQEAADWLAIHGANTYGVDKVSFRDRLQWVAENQEKILACANSPLDEVWWREADKPWQFLAFCFEWLGYVTHGLSWASQIPIALDGSCNGLQHFSAMLRDEVGGASVNLLPVAKPADIYQVVADKVTALLEKSADPMAALWLSVGITRKTTKRCVMTRPYGATLFAFKAEVQSQIIERGVSEKFGPDFKNFRAAQFLAGVISQAIKGTVIKAEKAMDWLQGLSDQASKSGLPINWVTPSGFAVLQRYMKPSKKQIRVRLLSGQDIQLRTQDDSDDIDRKGHRNGMSPNFVHSMDASVMMETIGAALDVGIDSFAMIHDSYGTHAADTERLTHVIREAFVSFYESADVLANLRSSVSVNNDIPKDDIPLPPSRGLLDLKAVLASPYFFA